MNNNGNNINNGNIYDYYDSNSDSSVRLPDNIIKEKLIDDDNDFYEENKFYEENEINKIIEQSKNEFDFIQKQEEQKNVDLLIQYHKEEFEKKYLNKFNNLKTQLNKLLVLDKSNADSYELLLSIIEIFENGLLDFYHTNKETYVKIFRILKNIRILPSELNLLEQIITCNLDT